MSSPSDEMIKQYLDLLIASADEFLMLDDLIGLTDELIKETELHKTIGVDTHEICICVLDSNSSWDGTEWLSVRTTFSSGIMTDEVHEFLDSFPPKVSIHTTHPLWISFIKQLELLTL